MFLIKNKHSSQTIGFLQWSVSIGRIDITTDVMTLSSFCAVPCVGHLERAKRVVSYLAKMKNAVIRFRTGIPDYSDIPDNRYEWEHSVYGNVREELPNDAPKALRNPVVLTHYMDANLFHDIATGRSVTGILHFINQTPIDWYSKKASNS